MNYQTATTMIDLDTLASPVTVPSFQLEIQIMDTKVLLVLSGVYHKLIQYSSHCTKDLLQQTKPAQQCPIHRDDLSNALRARI